MKSMRGKRVFALREAKASVWGWWEGSGNMVYEGLGTYFYWSETKFERKNLDTWFAFGWGLGHLAREVGGLCVRQWLWLWAMIQIGIPRRKPLMWLQVNFALVWEEARWSGGAFVSLNWCIQMVTQPAVGVGQSGDMGGLAGWWVQSVASSNYQWRFVSYLSKARTAAGEMALQFEEY